MSRANIYRCVAGKLFMQVGSKKPVVGKLYMHHRGQIYVRDKSGEKDHCWQIYFFAVAGKLCISSLLANFSVAVVGNFFKLVTVKNFVLLVIIGLFVVISFYLLSSYKYIL